MQQMMMVHYFAAATAMVHEYEYVHVYVLLLLLPHSVAHPPCM